MLSSLFLTLMSGSLCSGSAASGWSSSTTPHGVETEAWPPPTSPFLSLSSYCLKAAGGRVNLHCVGVSRHESCGRTGAAAEFTGECSLWGKSTRPWCGGGGAGAGRKLIRWRRRSIPSSPRKVSHRGDWNPPAGGEKELSSPERVSPVSSRNATVANNQSVILRKGSDFENVWMLRVKMRHLIRLQCAIVL